MRCPKKLAAGVSLLAALCLAASLRAQTPQPTPPSPVATPSSGGPPSPVSLITSQISTPLTLEEALRLANVQASSYQEALLNERIAGEDVKQAKAALLPKLSAPLSYIYTTPELSPPPGQPRMQSFIANNALSEYEAVGNLAGDADINGRLRAELAKNRALLAAAHAGTEVARRTLVQTVIEAYYSLALATAQRSAAEQNLAAAQEFERITSLLVSGGEVASIDLIRSQLQTAGRRDELERARANEAVAAGSLRVLVGYDFTRPIAVTDLALAMPADSEAQRFRAETISQRPEFAQFEGQRRAAREEIRIARAERLPQLTYTLQGGFDSDSLKPPRLRRHTGAAATFNLTIPIFDWGASRSKERQARLHVQIVENARAQAVRGFSQQFYAAQSQVNSGLVRIRLAAAGVTKAQVNLDTSIARYRAGEAQIIEVTDAQASLVTQKSALYQAIFEYQTALGRLRLAAGQ